MPLSAATITAGILSAGAGQSITGPAFPKLATAIGNGVYAWAVVPVNLVIQGITTGTVGAGITLGTLTIIPPNIAAVVNALAGANVLGVVAPRLATAVVTGIVVAFTGASYKGVSVGVGVGADAGMITATNGPALVGAIYAAMIDKGPAAFPVAQGLGLGIATQLLGSVAVGVVTGPPGLPGPPGTSISGMV
jgi:hypothetical protein